ncbi:MAG: DUF192 domain-containing protein [Hyphomicrobiales bacterium]|nr:DUF192 domain-containing protein [Hyphomicrobiales bacterium]
MTARVQLFSTRTLFAAGMAFFVIALLLSPVRAGQSPMVLPTDPTPLVIDGANGSHSFSIEIANTPQEQEQGLMYRQEMPDDHGMLFAFDHSEPLAFWMKNTPMPLDLVFVSSRGEVRAVRQGKPFSTDIISPNAPVRFVLELKAGMAEKAGISDGVVMHHPVIEAASHDQ